MKPSKLLTIGLSLCALSFSNYAAVAGTASKPSVFNQDQVQAINQAVHDYILANPNIVMEAAIKFRHESQVKQEQKTLKAALQERTKLFNDATQPIIGNPHGSVTLVELFDYQCVICYRAYKDIEALTKQNKNLRVVFRYLPIFGEASNYAAQVDLLAMKQNRYAVFHHNMFKAKNIEGTLTDKKINQIAKTSGIRLRELKTLRKQASFKTALKNNMELAKSLQIMGTPAFFIAPTTGAVTPSTMHFYGGLVPKTQLQRDITSLTKQLTADRTVK